MRSAQQDAWGRKAITPRTAADRKRLETERDRDALATILALQRKMRDRVRAQPAWKLPESGQV